MARRSYWTRPAVLLGLALCALAALLSIVSSFTGGSNSAKAVALSTSAGAEAYPAFGPEGNRLVFSAREGKTDDYHLFVRSLPSGQRTQLTSAKASDVGAVWSPDGSSIAFLRIEEDSAECMTIPAAGGPERKLADCGTGPEKDHPWPAIAWMPGGKSLAISATGDNQSTGIAIVPASGGPVKRLTSPPAGAPGDSTPAISPDGKSIAFVRSGNADGANIYVSDESGGEPRQLTFDDRPIRGVAWLPDGAAVVYGGFRMGDWRLWRVSAGGGSPTAVTDAGTGAQYPAVAASLRRLAFVRSQSSSALWRSEIGTEGEGRPLIRSSGREYAPSFSWDGKRIVDISDESGADEVWTCDSDGQNRVQLTHVKGASRPASPRLSPDGRWVLYESRGMGSPAIDIIPATGGEAKRVLIEASNASWSPDGKSLYFVARNAVWKASADGSGRKTISPQNGFGASQPEGSPDGKYVYYRNWRSIRRIAIDGGGDEEVVQSENGAILGGPKVTAKGLYYVEVAGRRRGAALVFYDFATKKTSTLTETERVERAGVAISPDGKYFLYPRVDESDTRLMLIDGFRR